MPDPHWSGRNDASPAKNGHHVRGVTGQGRLSRAASQRPQAIRLLRFRLWGSNVEDGPPDAARFASQCHVRLVFRGTSRSATSDVGGGSGRRRRGSGPIDNMEATHRHASSCRECNKENGGKARPLPLLPVLQERLEGPDTVRTLATRHGILIGDGSVHAAGPMRGHGQSRLSDTCSDLRSPNGVRTRVSTLRE